MLTRLWKRRYLILVLVIGGGMVYWVVDFYSTFWDQVDLRRWREERRRGLEALGERMLTFARSNQGRLPENLEEMIKVGLIARSEVDFVELRRGVRVTRKYRPVPTTEFPPELVLVVERYEPPADEGSELGFYVLLLDGSIVGTRNVAYFMDMINEDNRVREAQNLPPLL